MRLSIDTGIKKDLTTIQMATLDAKLHSQIPSLVGWSYSPLTGELNLNLDDSEDTALLSKIQDLLAVGQLTLNLNNLKDSALFSKIQDFLVKVGGVKVLRFEILGTTKQWAE
jgi:hypothetical protein